MKNKGLILLTLVLPLFPLLQVTNTGAVDGGYLPTTVLGTVTYDFIEGQWNLFGIPFDTSYTAYSFGMLCGAISVVEYDLLTGDANSFLIGLHNPNTDDFPLQRGHGYYIWVDSDITISLSGSIDCFYYPGINQYEIQSYPTSLGGDVAIPLTYPSFFSRPIGELFNSRTLTPDVRVESVWFLNEMGEPVEYSFSEVIYREVTAGEAFFIRFSDSTVWDSSEAGIVSPPIVEITSPSNFKKTFRSSITIYTTDCLGFADYVKFYLVDRSTGTDLHIGTDTIVSSSWQFSHSVSLNMGYNFFRVKAFDVEGNQLSVDSVAIERIELFIIGGGLTPR